MELNEEQLRFLDSFMLSTEHADQWKEGLLSEKYALRLLSEAQQVGLTFRFESGDTVEPTQHISIDSYQKWREIRATLPEGTRHEFLRVTSGDDGPSWDVAHLFVPHGPFTLEQYVQLARDDEED
jgi:hypothetical protein